MRTEDMAEELAFRQRNEDERRGRLPRSRTPAQVEAGELAVLTAEFLYRRDQNKAHPSQDTGLAMAFAEDRLREHPAVARQLSFYKEQRS